MANHVRQQIRTAVLALLKNNTTAGAYVRLVDAVPTEQDDLPAIIIYTKEEEAGLDDATMGQARSQQRSLQVIIEIQAKGESVQNKLDHIAAEVEPLMSADRTIGGLAKDSWLADTAADFDGEGANFIATLALLYQVDYRTVEGVPTVAV